jgi:hypothetical protein
LIIIDDQDVHAPSVPDNPGCGLCRAALRQRVQLTGPRILLWHASYRSPASREDKGRAEQHRGRGHQVVDAGEGKVRTAVTVRGELRQLSGP